MITRPRLLAAVAIVAVLTTACPASTPDTPAAQAIRVGVTPDAEGTLLAHLISRSLGEADIESSLVSFEDSGAARQALELGHIDVLHGYTGATWLDVLGRADPPGDPNTSWRRVRQLDDDLNDIIWLSPSFDRDYDLDVPPANATFALFIKGPPSADANLAGTSDLARLLASREDARLCVDPEFLERADGLEAVLRAYAIEDVEIAALEPADAVAAVASGLCTAGLSTATDGRAWSMGLRPVRDELFVFPAFVVGLQLPAPIATRRSDVTSALEPIMNMLTTALLANWNARVAVGEPVELVAMDAYATLVARERAAEQPE